MRQRSEAITIVAFDPSSNALGRSLLLAELVARDFDVRIIGICTTHSIWPPARAGTVPLETIVVHDCVRYPAAAAWLRRVSRGSRLIVHKPLATSLGLTLIGGINPRSMLLDVDDWDLGLYRSHGRNRRLRAVRELLHPRHLNSYASTRALDWVARHLPHRVVSNTWLQARFGGRVLPHVRDTDALNPERVDRAAVRAELGLGNRPWVGFVGTPRAHKGLDDLVDALALIGDSGAPGLFLAGGEPSEPYVAGLLERARALLGDARVISVGSFPLSDLPRMVAAPDIICLPSRSDPGAIGQLPAKLFDAMAMAKPVIASHINDIPEALDGCGLLVQPGDIAGLTDAVRALSADASRRLALGAIARQRAVDRYSYRAGRRTLLEALSEVRPFGDAER